MACPISRACRPTGWTLTPSLPAEPGVDEIQLDLFLDYASNVALYPAFQSYFRRASAEILRRSGGRTIPLPAGGRGGPIGAICPMRRYAFSTPAILRWKPMRPRSPRRSPAFSADKRRAAPAFPDKGRGRLSSRAEMLVAVVDMIAVVRMIVGRGDLPAC